MPESIQRYADILDRNDAERLLDGWAMMAACTLLAVPSVVALASILRDCGVLS